MKKSQRAHRTVESSWKVYLITLVGGRRVLPLQTVDGLSVEHTRYPSCISLDATQTAENGRCRRRRKRKEIEP